MLLKKSVVSQLLYRRPLVRVLLQTTVQKVTHLRTHEQVTRYLDLILYYLNELLLPCYLKRVLPDHHLVHHNANRPNIYLLIVLLPLQDLRTHVQRSTAKSSTQLVVLVHRPPEIAQLDNVLSKKYLTSCNTIFSGLISR